MEDPSSGNSRSGNANRLFACSREECLLAIGGLSTAVVMASLLVIKYSLFTKLDSNCNLRLLHSVQAWVDHGYWRLGGMLSFQEKYDGSFPIDLYKSHAPYYVLPHYWATLIWGEGAFWSVTGLIPILSATIMGMATAVIAWAGISSPPRSETWARIQGAPFVGAVAAFSITFSSEPVWSLAWNSFDGSYSIILMTLSLAIAFLARHHHVLRRLSIVLFLLSALLCARFGLAMTASLLFIRFFTIPKRILSVSFPGADFFKWPVIILSLLLALSHFVRVSVVEKLLGMNFRGSDLLPRIGLSSWWENAGQGPLHYLTPLDAFTFLWRQSENVINRLPIWISIHHLIFWSIALISFASFVGNKSRFYPARPCLELLLFLPLCWTIVLNQSAAEHPDLISILWLPVYSIGLSFLAVRLFGWLKGRVNRTHSYLYMLGVTWLFFLWQNQYFMRAYTQL